MLQPVPIIPLIALIVNGGAGLTVKSGSSGGEYYEGISCVIEELRHLNILLHHGMGCNIHRPDIWANSTRRLSMCNTCRTKCNAEVVQYVPQGYHHREVISKCGSTGHTGEELRCERCEKIKPWYICEGCGSDISEYDCPRGCGEQ